MKHITSMNTCPSTSSSSSGSTEWIRPQEHRLPVVDRVPEPQKSGKFRSTPSFKLTHNPKCNPVRPSATGVWSLKRLHFHSSDASESPKLDFSEDFDEDSDADSGFSEEVAFILNLGFLEENDDKLGQQDDDSHFSITEDSLNVTRRRAIKKKESKMKPLSDFRRSFARCTLAHTTNAITETRNTTSPPCA